MGYRLPLASLVVQAPGDEEPVVHPDPFEAKAPLPASTRSAGQRSAAAGRTARKPRRVIKTALCVEARDGVLHVFLPPLPTVEAYTALVARIEDTCVRTQLPVRIEGYLPPSDPRLVRLFVTPDPGVIEVNIHPAASWRSSSTTPGALRGRALHAARRPRSSCSTAGTPARAAATM
jgi:uncharacterized protein (DUF2126 family)